VLGGGCRRLGPWIWFWRPVRPEPCRDPFWRGRVALTGNSPLHNPIPMGRAWQNVLRGLEPGAGPGIGAGIWRGAAEWASWTASQTPTLQQSVRSWRRSLRRLIAAHGGSGFCGGFALCSNGTARERRSDVVDLACGLSQAAPSFEQYSGSQRAGPWRDLHQRQLRVESGHPAADFGAGMNGQQQVSSLPRPLVPGLA